MTLQNYTHKFHREMGRSKDKYPRISCNLGNHEMADFSDVLRLEISI